MQEDRVLPIEEKKIASDAVPEEERSDEILENKKALVEQKSKKSIRQVLHGRVYIHASYNNTLVTVTDDNGDALASSSAGRCGFRGPKKSTPYAASMIIKDLSEKVKAYGVRDVNVFVKGVGTGRESAIRSLNGNGFNVISIKDITPIPHNGCRPAKPRRV
jgi:small subunit ribosomal protein S11